MTTPSIDNIPRQDDVLDLGEIWEIIWRSRKLISIVTLTFGLLGAGISLLIPNVYRAEVLIVPVNDDSSNGSSSLSQLGAVASLAGISIGSSSSVDENLAVLRSRTFLWTYIEENGLMPILFADDWDNSRKTWKKPDPKKQPSLWDAYRMFTKGGLLSVDKDKKSDLVTVAVEWTDPEMAANWANGLVVRLNEYLRQQAIKGSQRNLQYLGEALAKTQVQEIRQSLFDLISKEQKSAMIASAQKEFAFKVIDSASAPDKKVKPKRALITLMTALIASILAVIYVIYRARNTLSGNRK